MMERNFNRRYANEYGIRRSLFYLTFLHTVVDFVFNFMYDFEIFGQENIPKNKKFLYAANHVSQFDPPIVTFLTRKKIAYMAKEELFNPADKLMQWLVSNLGAFAVKRTKPEIATFKTVKDILKTDWSLGVFPQGGTFPYGSSLENVKKGFAVIAKHAKFDIIPIAIAEFSGYPIFKPFRKQKFKAFIGKPISYKLSEEEIVEKWCSFIMEHADYIR